MTYFNLFCWFAFCVAWGALWAQLGHVSNWAPWVGLLIAAVSAVALGQAVLP